MAEEAHSVRAHARFGGSTIHRTMECPGWAQLAGDIQSPASSYAAEGTMAHELGERCLLTGIDPEDMVDRPLDIGGEPVTAEMAEAVAVYVNYVRSRLEPGDILRVEQKVSLAALDPPEEMFGITDTAIIAVRRRLLEVIDYKHGAGVFVPATTPQLKYYGVGTLFSLPQGIEVPTTVRLTIVQPRAFSPEGPIRSVEMPTLELLDWGWGLGDIVRRALEPDPPLNPGSHCRFCPAAAFCPAIRKEAEQVVGDVLFGDQLPTQPWDLDVRDIAKLMDRMPLVETWMSAVKARAREMLASGTQLPGWKLVPRQGNRNWSDPEEAVVALVQRGASRKELVTSRVISPSKALKLFAPKVRAEIEKDLTDQGIITRRPGEPVLARSEDSRPAIEDAGCRAGEVLAIFDEE